VFYLKYDIYRNAWPLLALATCRKLFERQNTKNGPVNGAARPMPAEAQVVSRRD
jgi:hypothetical protein